MWQYARKRTGGVRMWAQNSCYFRGTHKQCNTTYMINTLCYQTFTEPCLCNKIQLCFQQGLTSKQKAAAMWLITWTARRRTRSQTSNIATADSHRQALLSRINSYSSPWPNINTLHTPDWRVTEIADLLRPCHYKTNQNKRRQEWVEKLTGSTSCAHILSSPESHGGDPCTLVTPRQSLWCRNDATDLKILRNRIYCFEILSSSFVDLSVPSLSMFFFGTSELHGLVGLLSCLGCADCGEAWLWRPWLPFWGELRVFRYQSSVHILCKLGAPPLRDFWF